MKKQAVKNNKTVAFCTLGCKVNQYETNAMMQEFTKHGYSIVEFETEADIYVVNTCTVTNMADKKSRQMLRKVKEINKEAILVAVGCYAQVAKQELEKIPEIDLILGINEKKDVVAYIEKFVQEKEQTKQAECERDSLASKGQNIVTEKTIAISDVLYQKEFVDFGTVTYTEKTRAVIKVQDGCDRYCSYCLIPYARGRVRSRRPDSVIAEIQEIAQNGIKEVVITGIHIASYGKDFNDEIISKINQTMQTQKEEYRLIDLLEEINKIEGIQRIRLGSIEPTLITEEFVQRLSKLDKICDHFHLSLQSGCTETLKRMNRRYTTEEFEIVTQILRKYYPHAALTTDIIVGFPGETEEEFKSTYEYLKKIAFYKMHVFKYSPRKGTKAAVMPNQVDGNIKEERSKELIALSDENEKKYNQEYIGKMVEVLFEDENVQDGETYIKGHTTNYIVVKVKQDEKKKLKSNTIEKVQIIGIDGVELIGRV